MVELMSKIIRNAQAGCRGDGNLIEQNDIFVQLKEGRAREGGDSCFDKVNVSPA